MHAHSHPPTALFRCKENIATTHSAKKEAIPRLTFELFTRTPKVDQSLKSMVTNGIKKENACIDVPQLLLACLRHLDNLGGCSVEIVRGTGLAENKL